jgi:FtsP/CotA-like multicopper oxidase with cupredoxin domain
MLKHSRISRRSLLSTFGLAGLGVGASSLLRWLPGTQIPAAAAQTTDHQHLGGNMVAGDVDPAVNGFDPTQMLTDFDYGTVSTLPSGQTVRDYRLVASDKQIEIAPGVKFSAWAYNDRVPGPTLRCTQGDRVRVTFINASSHPHSIHFHGIHSPAMDGGEAIPPGGQTVYEFDAEPFGLHLYHCHVAPLLRHIHKGLYGTFIIDPPTPRVPANEFVMVMNAFDTNFDRKNEFYAVNTVAFHYAKHPIPLKQYELVRVYLVNLTEFDLLNSFHLHANLFHVFRTGTQLEPHEFTDIITMSQGERHILEFSFKFPGQYMFHAHQSEFTELGWMGIFDVQAPTTAAALSDQQALFGVCELPSQKEQQHG